MAIFIWSIGVVGALIAMINEGGVVSAIAVLLSAFISGMFFFMLKQIIDLLGSINNKLDSNETIKKEAKKEDVVPIHMQVPAIKDSKVDYRL